MPRTRRESLTVRLDGTARRRLASVARRRGRTPSDLVRTALDEWLAAEESLAASSAHEAMADLVGVVDGKDPLRSTRGARAIAQALLARRR